MLLLLCYGKLLIALIQTHTHTHSLSLCEFLGAVFFCLLLFISILCVASATTAHTLFRVFQFNSVCPFFSLFFSFFFLFVAFVCLSVHIFDTLWLRRNLLLLSLAFWWYSTWGILHDITWDLLYEIFRMRSSTRTSTKDTQWQRNIADLIKKNLEFCAQIGSLF